MIANTLYAKYIKERYGQQILENDLGFIIYKINGPECFIVEMEVAKEERRKGRGRGLLDQLCELVKDCHFVTANIHIKIGDPNTVLKSALACGFKVRACDNNILLIAKNLLED